MHSAAKYNGVRGRGVLGDTAGRVRYGYYWYCAIALFLLFHIPLHTGHSALVFPHTEVLDTFWVCVAHGCLRKCKWERYYARVS